MAKRIPPKGTPGYRAYWADRYLWERAYTEADNVWQYLEGETDPLRRGYLQSAHNELREAGHIIKTMWEDTNYHTMQAKEQ